MAVFCLSLLRKIFKLTAASIMMLLYANVLKLYIVEPHGSSNVLGGGLNGEETT